jgi:hypothetical protein
MKSLILTLVIFFGVTSISRATDLSEAPAPQMREITLREESLLIAKAQADFLADFESKTEAEVKDFTARLILTCSRLRKHNLDNILISKGVIEQDLPQIWFTYKHEMHDKDEPLGTLCVEGLLEGIQSALPKHFQTQKIPKQQLLPLIKFFLGESQYLLYLSTEFTVAEKKFIEGDLPLDIFLDTLEEMRAYVRRAYDIIRTNVHKAVLRSNPILEKFLNTQIPEADTFSLGDNLSEFIPLSVSGQDVLHRHAFLCETESMHYHIRLAARLDVSFAEQLRDNDDYLQWYVKEKATATRLVDYGIEASLWFSDCNLLFRKYNTEVFTDELARQFFVNFLGINNLVKKQLFYRACLGIQKKDIPLTLLEQLVEPHAHPNSKDLTLDAETKVWLKTSKMTKVELFRHFKRLILEIFLTKVLKQEYEAALRLTKKQYFNWGASNSKVQKALEITEPWRTAWYFWTESTTSFLPSCYPNYKEWLETTPSTKENKAPPLGLFGFERDPDSLKSDKKAHHLAMRYQLEQRLLLMNVALLYVQSLPTAIRKR